MSDTTLPVPARLSGPNSGAVLDRLRGLAAQPAVQRSLPLLGIVAAIAIAVVAWMSFATGPQRDLFAGISDGDKAAVADTLGGAGIKYSIDRSTGALTVGDGDYYRAKMLLAQAGLPKSAPDGGAIMATMPMGASRAVEGERLRASREQDLARTIEAIDAVETAKVHLAAEQASVFVRDTAPASASVMLRLHQGRALGLGQVQAIVNLVASSVPGLSPDNVSVVDQSGKLLSRNGEGAGDRQLDMQSKAEQRYLDAIAKLLTPIVGADGFTAEVHADLDFAESQATRESYPKDTAVIAQEKGGWNNDAAGGGAGQAAGGIPGALANQPPAAAQVSTQPGQALTPTVPQGQGQAGTTAAAAAGKTSENYDRTFQLGREVSVTRNPVGTVKRLSVAVALKQGAKPRGVAELSQLEGLIKGAVGFDQARGDQFALTSRAFAESDLTVTAPKWYESPWIAIVGRNLTGLVIALLTFFGVIKPLMKRRAAIAASQAAAPRPSARLGGEIAAALASQASADPGARVTLDMIEAAPGYADRAALIRNFVRQDPDRAALVVRDLIRADMPGGAEQNG